MQGARFGCCLAVACAAAGAVEAHVTLAEDTARPGATYRAVLQVGHGCEGGLATTAIRVLLDGIASARPMPKPGWDLATTRGPVTRPGGGTVEGVREIMWSGGDLPTDWYDEFVFVANLPRAEPGTVLYFPVVQECGTVVHRWIEIPLPDEEASDLAEPAPSVTLIDAPAAADAALRAQ